MSEEYHVVLDVGNTQISAAFFQKNMIVEMQGFSSQKIKKEDIQNLIQNKKIAAILVGIENYPISSFIIDFFEKCSIPCYRVEYNKLSLIFDICNPNEIAPSRIASAYGAFITHPDTDLIIVHMKETIIIDVFARERRFLGASIFPGPHMCAKILQKENPGFPLIELTKPKSCFASTMEESIQSGIYYNLVGSIREIIQEIIRVHFGRGNVQVIGTGYFLGSITLEPDSHIFANLRICLENDLKESVQFFEPDLAFFGYLEILKEKILQDNG